MVRLGVVVGVTVTSKPKSLGLMHVFTGMLNVKRLLAQLSHNIKYLEKHRHHGDDLLSETTEN